MIPQMIVYVMIGIVSYLIGSINFSILISKAISGKDIRESGSGNAGATNMLRTHGKKMGVLILLLDVLKGIAVVLIAIYIKKIIHNGDILYDARVTLIPICESVLESLPYIAAVCVVLGHNFPIFFAFKGGKGVATSLGVVLMLDWKIGLAVAVVAIAIMAITRYVSLGSIIGGAAFIAAEIIKSAVTGNWNIIQLICVVILGGLLIARHHANIGRLLKGTENKLSFSKKEN